MIEYTVFGYQGGTLIGEVPYSRLEVVRRFCSQGRYEMTVPISAIPPGLLFDYDTRIDVKRDDATFFTGRQTFSERVWDRNTDEISVRGRDGLYFVKGRLASPVPSGPPYSGAAYDVRSGAAESVIKQYVNYNCGPLAVATRRWPWLTLETDYSRGATITGRARFDNLLELCQSLGIAGGVGFEIVADNFRVYIPTDKTAAIRFDLSLGNVEDFYYAAEIAAANYYVVGGGGEGTARVFYERGDPDSMVLCGRWEDFADRRDTTDTALMEQEIVSRLPQSKDTLQLHVDATELPNMVFGQDFYLGDLVQVVVDEQLIAAQVQEHGLVVNREGVTSRRFEVGSFGITWNALKQSPFAQSTALLERRM